MRRQTLSRPEETRFAVGSRGSGQGNLTIRAPETPMRARPGPLGRGVIGLAPWFTRSLPRGRLQALRPQTANKGSDCFCSG